MFGSPHVKSLEEVPSGNMVVAPMAVSRRSAGIGHVAINLIDVKSVVPTTDATIDSGKATFEVAQY
jgi:hypothetical protein